MKINATVTWGCRALALALALLGGGAGGCGHGGGDQPDGSTADAAADTGAPRLSKCGPVDDPEGNDDVMSATPLPWSRTFDACADGPMDHDVYALVAPASAAGGYVTVTVTGVGTGQVAGRLVTRDGSELAAAQSARDGQGFELFYATAPGSTVFLDVRDAAGARVPFPYHLEAVHHTIDDPSEPNDTRETAAQVALGAPIQAFMFAGHGEKGTIARAAYDDWFSFEAQGGDLDVRVQGLPPDVDLNAVLHDGQGAEVGKQPSNMLGGNLTFTLALPAPGRYTMQLGLFTAKPKTAGAGSSLPDHFAKGYELTFSQ